MGIENQKIKIELEMLVPHAGVLAMYLKTKLNESTTISDELFLSDDVIVEFHRVCQEIINQVQSKTNWESKNPNNYFQ